MKSLKDKNQYKGFYKYIKKNFLEKKYQTKPLIYIKM